MVKPGGLDGESPTGDVTRLLQRAARGDSEAAESVLPFVYQELRAVADAWLARESAAHTLQPTALVHEAWMRLHGGTPVDWETRRHFLVTASRTMRRILVDHARGRDRQKRGGSDRHRVTLSAVADVDAGGAGHGPASDPVDLLALEEVMGQLEALDARKAHLVELRFYGGLTLDQAAEVLGVARSTASEEWRMARAWLARRL